MTPCFIRLKRLAHPFCSGLLLRGLLLCVLWAAGGVPIQARAQSTCLLARPTTTIYENPSKQIIQIVGGRGITTLNFKYPMVSDYVVFSGYVTFTVSIRPCAESNLTFQSNLTDGTITNNPGLSLVAGQASVNTACQAAYAPIIGLTSVTIPNPYNGGGCTLTFPFTIKTNASVAPLTTATKYGQTSTSPNIAYSVVNTNGGYNAAPFIFAFSPNSCVLTSTAPNVDLGQVPLGSARSPGSVGWTTFSLNFSNCGAPEAAYTIQSTFSYTAYDASNPTLIANNGGTASNVGVEMALNDGVTTLASGTAYTLATTTSGVSSYTVPLKARIRAAAGQTPTAGTVKATATFTVAYP